MKRLFYLILFLPTLVFAQQDLVTPGQNSSKAGGTTVFNTGDVINVNFDLNRSYSCTLLGVSSDSILGLDSNVVSPNGSVVASKAVGAQTPPVTIGVRDTNQADNRISVFSTIRGVWKFTVRSAKNGGEEGSFACRETSLYGSWNTFINPINFLETTNLSYDPIEIILILKNFNGTTISVSEIVPADTRLDIDIHTLVGLNGYGSIKLKHDGPVGALSALISQYNKDQAGATVLRSSIRLLRRDSID